MQDVLYHTDGDLLIEDGDFVVGYSDDQHRDDIMMVDKGDYKEFPDLGVGIYKYLEAESMSDLLREIKVQFTADGMVVDEIKVLDTGKIAVDAKYE
jgi:hypothetical protein